MRYRSKTASWEMCCVRSPIPVSGNLRPRAGCPLDPLLPRRGTDGYAATRAILAPIQRATVSTNGNELRQRLNSPGFILGGCVVNFAVKHNPIAPICGVILAVAVVFSLARSFA